MMATHMYQELDEKVPPKATAISANWTARLAKRILSDLGSPKRERKDIDMAACEGTNYIF